MSTHRAPGRDPAGTPGSHSDQTPGPRPAPRCAIASATGWLQTNHPFWLMQLAAAACDSPPGVDELSGLRLAGQIVINRKRSICVPEGLSASEVGEEIAERREHATAEHAQKDRWVAIVEAVLLSSLCWPHDRVARPPSGHGIAFSSERFSGGELPVDSQPPAREARAHRVACEAAYVVPENLGPGG